MGWDIPLDIRLPNLYHVMRFSQWDRTEQSYYVHFKKSKVNQEIIELLRAQFNLLPTTTQSISIRFYSKTVA